MLSAAIVIFREVFEIVLILGVILAATRNLPGRNKWILGGIGLGLLGSTVVAYFTETIANFAEGSGQEIFNAMILFIASLFIAWTVLWMQKHGRHIKKNFETISASIASGELEFISLSAVIALAILREGTEIILFSYGMIASGQSWFSLASGASIGIVSGLAVGTLFYLGLISFSTKIFFRITSILLILLVAGMVSQAVGFLTSAGYVEHFTATLWDSSWLVNEQGLLGKSLHALLGYTSHPTGIQVMVYSTTATILLMLTNMLPIPSRRNKGLAAA